MAGLASIGMFLLTGIYISLKVSGILFHDKRDEE